MLPLEDWLPPMLDKLDWEAWGCDKFDLVEFLGGIEFSPSIAIASLRLRTTCLIEGRFAP